MMLQGLLSAFYRSRAARKYVQRLGPQLSKDYGASEFYNPVQIEASVRRAQLPIAYIRFGYSLFLPKEAFLQLESSETETSHQETRSFLLRYKPSRPTSGVFDPVHVNQYALSGTSGREAGS